MLLDLSASFNRLCALLWRQPACPPATPPGTLCPLAHPHAPLPAWVANDPVVQQYRTLLADLPWADFPERPTDRPWPGPRPDPRAPFVAAYLVKLHEGKRFLSDLRSFLIKHPALVYYLGFERVLAPSTPYDFDVAATVPKRRQFSSVLRELPNPSLQFLLSATVELLRATLPLEEQATFGDTIAGDTQAILAWVKQNNPKQYIKEGRLDKNRQPKADPDCKLGVKKSRNRAPADADGAPDDPPAPTTDAKPTREVQVGVDILWGYASGIVVTRLPDHTEVVLAERTRPFNESDPSYFFPLMQQVEQHLGRKPRYGTWDCAYDAHYVYEYFHQAGGFAAVPFNPGKKGANRQFAPDGAPLCAAGLAMPRLLSYYDRTSGLIPHQREKCACPLLYPQPTGEICPIAHPRLAPLMFSAPLITHIETTEATLPDAQALGPIHNALQERDLLPEDHLLDAGYVDSERLVESRRDYQVNLLGPVPADGAWQARAEQGYDVTCFSVDWDAQTVTCPTGAQSTEWKPTLDRHDKEVIHVEFARQTCAACAMRAQCTRSKTAGRELTLRPREQHSDSSLGPRLTILP